MRRVLEIFEKLPVCEDREPIIERIKRDRSVYGNRKTYGSDDTYGK